MTLHVVQSCRKWLAVRWRNRAKWTAADQWKSIVSGNARIRPGMSAAICCGNCKTSLRLRLQHVGFSRFPANNHEALPAAEC
jgi:hypothetical protein